ncbi:DNA anti-recombination protein RmuC [Parabacteroides sp. PF5-5]|uniref:DNA recombination protein RmuC n=1 Tax=unclassified Parabacteroides TaxID=2649774 RepID=UPI002473C7B5|nr:MULTISPECIES: DNA recombination protein RmuC [unclassified Parabacteroides]MDH6305905.1 DNA anti-recombination protein RmuC [Parabacteroides sp. PH5-39]MDH6317282.1 DNA anti-recombination protein RmuC [Parabacteroides sp. PF5-13]MDH6320490.1 DNA anti-recombination protein RmuC [Parabacteroides sp. PH5-13]MDH6324348.1 DNA anti-recombination protein RmuC [Parabacteroides sp. PH5-8]MDH6328544.1 DNA anti-recombination protein RmuC [Parabacteroides sp. PH5-41]
METIIVSGIVVIIIIQLLIFFIKRKPDTETADKLHKSILSSLDRVATNSREDASLQRQETRQISIDTKNDLTRSMTDFRETFERYINIMNDMQREKFESLDKKQQHLIDNTEKRLEEIRVTVDEKLQKTLDDRLSQSFRMVSEYLDNVQKGLGEMNTLAQDIGSLKRILGNVKTRGNMGELQLGMMLEQILAPDQYEANVRTSKKTDAVVDYAIKLPGKDNKLQCVYLPIDAKFPKEVYEQLLHAYDLGDPHTIELYGKLLESTIRKMAKDIHDQCIDPPYTTDFGIIFLPFEGIYAEVVRRSQLLEDLQRNYKVIVTGPTTLAAILNSLQVGFRSLTIQKYSSEVWTILGAVKKEFEKVGGMLEKAHQNIRIAGGQIEEVLGTRTRVIQRKLKDVDTLSDEEARSILPEIGPLETVKEEEDVLQNT